MPLYNPPSAGGAHPDLATHDTLGLATDDELTTHAATAHGPTDATYLVGAAHAGLSAEIVVGTTPGGELGGTWASPTVDSSHSGSTHAATQAAAEATAASALSTHAGEADPHTGYRLESADHSHATTGLQGGTVAHGALTGLTTGDPHTQYQQESEKGAASGYASLDASTKVPYAQLPTGTAASTVAIGDHTHAGSSGPSVAHTSADQTITGVTLASVTELTLAVSANTSYIFDATLFHLTSATTVGARFGVVVPAGAVMRVGALQPQVGGLTAAIGAGAVSTSDTIIIAHTAGPGATNTTAILAGCVEVGATAGNLVIRAAAETAAGTVTVQKHSWLRMQAI